VGSLSSSKFLAELKIDKPTVVASHLPAIGS
jgi:hypothetical protein